VKVNLLTDTYLAQPLKNMIKYKILTIALLTILISCKQTEDIEQLKKEFLFDFGVYVEKISPEDNSLDRFTRDNEIYTIGRTFIYNYYIVENDDTLKIMAPLYTQPESDFQRMWEFVSANENNPSKIETISIKVLDGISNEQQTEVKYNNQFSVDPGFEPFSSTSGVIENKLNTWIHPHRDKYFMILELNPFPYIQKPFKIGNKWTWTLGIGDHWKDDRWKTWEGSIQNNYEYEITSKEKINTAIGPMDCWVVQGTATSEIGVTGLIAYFNEKNGFVKLDYLNIDKSRLTIEIKEIR
jgi:hypothetical protein